MISSSLTCRVSQGELSLQADNISERFNGVDFFTEGKRNGGSILSVRFNLMTCEIPFLRIECNGIDSGPCPVAELVWSKV